MLFLYGQQFFAGPGVSTILASLDFETYSEAGFAWTGKRWTSLQEGKPGIKCVGAWVYSEHPSADVLCAAYDLKDGRGRRLWRPGDLPPADLFAHLARGGLIEATNSFFEYAIWTNVCRRRFGWPDLPLHQVRDVAAKAAAWTLPRGLDDGATILKTPVQKDAVGHKVMLKVSKPRSPTKNDSRQRYTREDEPADFAALDTYCLDDIAAEDGVSLRCADLSPFETRVFLVDQAINVRGVHCDRDAINASLEIIEQAERRYHAELAHITGGRVKTSDELDNIKSFLRSWGLEAPSITKDTMPGLLATPGLPALPLRVLQIRDAMGSLSVKKTRAMRNHLSPDDRIRGLYTYCGAARTWRWAGRGPQAHNLPKKGPDVQRCTHCETVRWVGLWYCPGCFRYEAKPCAWGLEAATACIPALRTRSLDIVESLWGDALTAIAGCLRSFFTAAPGNELICSDLSAIEAVVIAELAGETWQQEVFRTHGKIYEATAERITGTTVAQFAEYKAANGTEHPDRALGKLASLASGFGGWVAAWIKFGADKFLTEEQMKQNILAWRKANPAIVALWAGLEAAAIRAVDSPGRCFGYRDLRFQVKGNVLYMQLPSGRAIPYHAPLVTPEIRFNKPHRSLSYMGVTDQSKWVRQRTYGGKLAENATQATARDIFAAGVVRLEDAGYPLVIHTHDEPCAEVRHGTGSIEEVERLMTVPLPWCSDWPVRASGGWRGPVYHKS